MPKSKVSKNKLFREFSKLNQRYVKRNYLKNLRKELIRAKDSHNLFQKEIMFILWAYDLEFFTLKYASENYGISYKKIGQEYVYPLVKEGILYKHFDKLTPSDTYEDHLFRDETKFNYRVRYALTQRGRLIVQRIYSNLEGTD
jgi:hypothetical protein